MIEFVTLRPNTYSYLINYGSEHKREKGTKMFIIKRKLSLKILKIDYLRTK